MDTCEDGVVLNKWVWMPILMAIYAPLVMIRRIEVFAITHIFADFMIFFTTLVVVIYAGISLADKGT